MAPSAPRLSPLSGAGLSLAGAVLLGLALPGTSLHALGLLSDPAPRALAAGVPLVAAVWAWLLLREAVPRSSHWRWAGASLALACAAALAALAAYSVAPGHRLLLLAPLATALVLAHGGSALLRHLAAPLALLLLAWPVWHDAVSQLSTPVLLGLSGEPGAWLARLAGADVQAVPGASGRYICQGPAGPMLAGLDASCSGASGMLALIILAIPLIALRRPSPWRILPWLGLGLGLVLAGNIARVALLFWLGSTRGFDAVFTHIHVSAGNALVLLVWIGMLLSLPLLGRPAVKAATVLPVAPRGLAPLLACLPALATCALLEVTEMRSSPPPPVVVPVATTEPALTTPPQLVPAGAAPEPTAVQSPVGRLHPVDLLPALPGWQRWPHASFPWAAGLFGPDTRAERLVYRRGEGRLFWIDVLICPRATDLARHTLAGCFDSHSYRVERRTQIDVAGQAVGSWQVADDGGLRWAVAEWTRPDAPLSGGPQARRCVVWRRVDAGTGAVEQAEVRELARLLITADAQR